MWAHGTDPGNVKFSFKEKKLWTFVFQEVALCRSDCLHWLYWPFTDMGVVRLLPLLPCVSCLPAFTSQMAFYALILQQGAFPRNRSVSLAESQSLIPLIRLVLLAVCVWGGGGSLNTISAQIFGNWKRVCRLLKVFTFSSVFLPNIKTLYFMLTF